MYKYYIGHHEQNFSDFFKKIDFFTGAGSGYLVSVGWPG